MKVYILQKLKVSYLKQHYAKICHVFFKYIFMIHGHLKDRDTPVIPSCRPGYAMCSSVVRERAPYESVRKALQNDITKYITKRHQIAC